MEQTQAGNFISLTSQQVAELRACIISWQNNTPPDRQKIEHVLEFLNDSPRLQKVG